jgi:hypothetical protein
MISLILLPDKKRDKEKYEARHHKGAAYTYIHLIE